MNQEIKVGDIVTCSSGSFARVLEIKKNGLFVCTVWCRDYAEAQTTEKNPSVFNEKVAISLGIRAVSKKVDDKKKSEPKETKPVETKPTEKNPSVSVKTDDMPEIESIDYENGIVTFTDGETAPLVSREEMVERYGEEYISAVEKGAVDLVEPTDDKTNAK